MAGPQSKQNWPSQPATGAFTITPADSDLARYARALYVGGTGNIRITTWNDDDVLFMNVPVGILPITAKRVWTTNTTATNIIGLD